MTVDEDWMRLRTRLVELVGVSGADILMDRPPGGWSDLVTNHTLDLRFAAWEERFDRKVDALEARGDRKFDAMLAEMRAGFAAIELRFEMQRADLIGEMDRRFRNQAWMAISTIVAVGGVIVAAIRL